MKIPRFIAQFRNFSSFTIISAIRLAKLAVLYRAICFMMFTDCRYRIAFQLKWPECLRLMDQEIGLASALHLSEWGMKASSTYLYRHEFLSIPDYRDLYPSISIDFSRDVCHLTGFIIASLISRDKFVSDWCNYSTHEAPSQARFALIISLLPFILPEYFYILRSLLALWRIILVKRHYDTSFCILKFSSL
jgi:hypothetical protein